MEQIGSEEQEHEGDRLFRQLGLEDMAHQEIVTENGTIQARDFLDVCGEHARPVIKAFDRMSVDDPRYKPLKNALKRVVLKAIQGDTPSL